MKNIFIILSLFAASHAFSQVAIGKDHVSNTSVSLEFGNANRGLLLPWVAVANMAPPADGTLIFDTADKKVKYRKSNTWFDLSVANNGTVDTGLQDLLTEQTAAKVAIGRDARTDTTPGILVLTDQTRAMVLPKVASPHLNIVRPEPGLIVFDTVTGQLAVFNGTVWSFWKP